jgi:hypothetical protein
MMYDGTELRCSEDQTESDEEVQDYHFDADVLGLATYYKMSDEAVLEEEEEWSTSFYIISVQIDWNDWVEEYTR